MDGGKKCSVSCGTVQMLILLTLNGVSSIQVADIAATLRIDSEKIRMALSAFTAERRKGIEVPLVGIEGSSKPKNVTDTDVVFPNLHFHQNKKVVRCHASLMSSPSLDSPFAVIYMCSWPAEILCPACRF